MDDAINCLSIFTQFDPVDLQKWHSSYTFRISLLVMPLMVGQLVHIHQLTRDYSLIPSVALVFILLAWVNTFLYAVPLHNQSLLELIFQ